MKLEKLAEVAVKVGLQLQQGQDLVITAPLAALPLVRLITKHAYNAGAGIVSTFYSDEETTLARFRYGQDGSFDKAAGWLYEGMAKAYEGGAARLAISGDNPMMLANEDPEKVARANKRHRWLTSQRWRRSPTSTSTGTSAPTRTRPGRGRSFPMCRRKRLSTSWRSNLFGIAHQYAGPDCGLG